MWTDEEIKGKILHKLARFGKFEASHTAIEHIQKGFPKDIVGRVKNWRAQARSMFLIMLRNEQFYHGAKAHSLRMLISDMSRK